MVKKGKKLKQEIIYRKIIINDNNNLKRKTHKI